MCGNADEGDLRQTPADAEQPKRTAINRTEPLILKRKETPTIKLDEQS
jgi:hypothetical protein